MAEAHQAVAPSRPDGEASPRHRAGGWLLAGGLAAFAVVLAVYLADLATHLNTMAAMRDLIVYRAGGLITRHVTPPYEASRYAPLYSWTGTGGVSFTYAPVAAVIFAAGSLLPWLGLRWAMTVASLAALVLSAWLMFGRLGYADRRVRAGATLLVTAAGLATEPVQQTLALGQINLLLMLLVVLDLMTARTRWWTGAGIGLAAGIKLIPLIFIPYLFLTGKFRQAGVAVVTFVITIGIGYAVLPHDSAHYWQDGTFLNANRIVFLGTRGNQSLHGLIIRFMGSVNGAEHTYLAVAAVVAVAGLAIAATLCLAGHPVAGMIGCALTALLVSPLSWDHHWVWAALGVGYLGHLAVRARGPARAGWGLAAAAVLAIFGCWPQFWAPGTALTPAGWVWYGPTQYFVYGDDPAYHEYHWNLLQTVAGNSFVLAGLLALAVLAVAAVRLREPAAAGLRASLRNVPRLS